MKKWGIADSVWRNGQKVGQAGDLFFGISIWELEIGLSQKKSSYFWSWGELQLEAQEHFWIFGFSSTNAAQKSWPGPARKSQGQARLVYPPHHIGLEHHFKRQLNHSRVIELAAGLSTNSPIHLLVCQTKHWIVRGIERFSPNPDGNLLCDQPDLQETEVPVWGGCGDLRNEN